MEPKRLKAAEENDEIIQWAKSSRARYLQLPASACDRLDVMKVIANNRSITTLDVSECEVRFATVSILVF
jgi:hypothetical protein